MGSRIGDSVTRGLLATNAMATAMCLPEGIMRLVDYGPIDPRRPKGPKWELSCNKQPRETKDRWCISYEPHYDLPAADYRTPEPAERLVAGVGNATGASVGLRTLTYLSWLAFQESQDPTPRGGASSAGSFFAPSSWGRASCWHSRRRAPTPAPSAFKASWIAANMRIALRNRAAARAFTRACEGRGAGALRRPGSVCLRPPYVFDNATFARRPQHPRTDKAWFLAPAARRLTT